MIDQSENMANQENIVALLLKAPQQVSHNIAAGRNLMHSALALLFVGLTCHALFGFAVGMFGGVSVAVMDVVKVPVVVLCSVLLCLPSLYVFSCVAGSPMTISQAFALGCSCLAMLGLLLVGLAPVAWLFSVSTESLPFVVMLTVFIWAIAMVFVLRYLDKLKANPMFIRQGGIKMWLLILMLVTLQMTTCMRPLLVMPEKGKGYWEKEKKFFMAHFGSTFDRTIRNQEASDESRSK